MDERWHVESKMRTSGNTAGTWDSVSGTAQTSRCPIGFIPASLILCAAPFADACSLLLRSTTSARRASATAPARRYPHLAGSLTTTCTALPYTWCSTCSGVPAVRAYRCAACV